MSPPFEAAPESARVRRPMISDRGDLLLCRSSLAGTGPAGARCNPQAARPSPHHFTPRNRRGDMLTTVVRSPALRLLRHRAPRGWSRRTAAAPRAASSGRSIEGETAAGASDSGYAAAREAQAARLHRFYVDDPLPSSGAPSTSDGRNRGTPPRRSGSSPGIGSRCDGAGGLVVAELVGMEGSGGTEASPPSPRSGRSGACRSRVRRTSPWCPRWFSRHGPISRHGTDAESSGPNPGFRFRSSGLDHQG